MSQTQPRGYFAIGIYGCKTEANIGTLWRSATLYGAAFVFTVRHRYRQQASDTPCTPRHTPLFYFDSIEDLHGHLPYSAPLVGIELDPRARMLTGYGHPTCAVYLLGAEDSGLPTKVRDKCHSLLQIETLRPESMNVATAGAILLHDRYVKTTKHRGE